MSVTKHLQMKIAYVLCQHARQQNINMLYLGSTVLLTCNPLIAANTRVQILVEDPKPWQVTQNDAANSNLAALAFTRGVLQSVMCSQKA